MSFESGSVSFRFMELPHAFPKDALALFAEHAAPALETTGASVVRGWVTGRHLLDTKIDEETAQLGGYYRLQLRESVRKVPAGYLKAECKMEELATLAALGRAFLKAPERAEIRAGVLERLLPNMPPQIKAYPFVYGPGEDHLFASVGSDNAFDALNGLLRETLGFSADAGDPAVLAERLRRVDVREWEGTSFSPEMKDEALVPAPGREFLTWLWFRAETGDGQVKLSDGSELGVLLEGPLAFVNEGNGAHTVTLRNGAPEVGAETKACLLAGKTLASARLTFAADADTAWRFHFDADRFAFRSLSLPKGEAQLDAASRFRERMEFLERWRGLFLDLYGSFIDLRENHGAWNRTVKAMREWVGSRTARR